MNGYKLSDEGVKQFEELIELFKEKMKSACEEILGKVYVDLPDWIESDSWMNFRNTAFDALRDYQRIDRYDAKKIRESILANHREQIIADINQDNIERIKSLEKMLDESREIYR